MTNLETLNAIEGKMQDLVNKHIVPNLRWYKGKYKRPRFFFRESGLTVVIGSLLLSVVSSAGDKFKGPTLAISLTVAICSSLAPFYRWDVAWHNRIKAQLELQSLLAQWELDLAAATIKAEPHEEIVEATQ